MKIDLLIDDAAHLLQAQQGRPASRSTRLETLIARGDPIDVAATELQTCLLQLFGIATDGTAPIGALSLLGEDLEAGEDYWLRIDPVCLQATRTHIVMSPLPADDLSMEEARALAGVLSPHFAATGYELVIGHPQRWYLRCPSPPRLQTRSPEACAGMLHEEQLPTGPDGAHWRRLITEAQMLLHPLEVNAAREAGGKLAANGIWPWGGGRSSKLAASRYSRVCSDQPLARGLARAAGIKATSMPENANQVLSDNPPDAVVLIVLERSASCDRLERQWLKPLVAALASGLLTELTLILLRRPHALGRRLTGSNLRRWWRRRRPLGTYA